MAATRESCARLLSGLSLAPPPRLKYPNKIISFIEQSPPHAKRAGRQMFVNGFRTIMVNDPLRTPRYLIASQALPC
jgi:hypothetical protein